MRVYNKSELPRTDPRDAQHRAYSVVQCTQTSVATVVCRTKLITLAKVNVPSQNVFFESRFGQSSGTKYPYFRRHPNFATPATVNVPWQNSSESTMVQSLRKKCPYLWKYSLLKIQCA